MYKKSLFSLLYRCITETKNNCLVWQLQTFWQTFFPPETTE